ncbi:MAG: hypothetical protein M3Z23_11435 [Acidobacteriota bacterium]|nr:hypothetical protein [Acidobacteriota bacterium]
MRCSGPFGTPLKGNLRNGVELVLDGDIDDKGQDHDRRDHLKMPVLPDGARDIDELKFGFFALRASSTDSSAITFSTMLSCAMPI